MVIAEGISIIGISGKSGNDSVPVSKDVKIEHLNTSENFVYWGDDNLLPSRILQEIAQDEVVFRSNEFNKAAHFGQGLSYLCELRKKDGVELDFTSIPEVDDWMEASNAQRTFAEFVEDYESLGNIVSSVVLSRNREKVALLLRKQADWSRWGKQDSASRKVKTLYYNSDWESYRASDTVEIPALDVLFPVDDLKSRNSGFEFAYRMKPIAAKRYYYDLANVEVLINSGTFEMRDMVKAFHKSRLKNGLGATFSIEVTETYLQSRLSAEDKTKWASDLDLRIRTLKTLKSEVDSFLSGSSNQGKTVISMLFKEQLKTGYEYVPGVTIKKLDTSLNVEGWLPTIQQLQAQSFLAMGVDPSNIGISNQSDGMNSGSEKKNAFYNNTATIGVDRMNTLTPFFFVAQFNNWRKKYPGFKWVVNDAPEIQHGNSQDKTSKQ